MAYSVDILYTKNEDFSNPSTVTESGQPNSVDIENLDSYEVYYTKAVLKNDGVVVDESTLESFQTLPAGTITLTHHSSVRDRYDYIVSYTYTSTYALSSAVLVCGVSNMTQGVIAGNTITFTVSGLVPGDAYVSQITAIDIYGESTQASLTLVMPVMNYVGITDTTATASTVECELDYVIDDGFTRGWVEYWYAGDDPSTDQPQGHNYFVDGETSSTIAGLTDGTTYQFRATICYGECVNYVTSNVVTATTVTDYDYDSKYFTIKNTGTGTTTVKLLSKSSSPLNPNPVVYVSTDNGSTWNSYSPTQAGNTLGTLSSGRKMLLKNSNGAMSPDNNVRLVITNSTNGPIELSGNIASLCFGDNFTGTKTMPDYAYASLFRETDSTVTAIDAQNLSFASYNSIGNHGMEGMFRNYAGTITMPNLSGITSVDDYGMTDMFDSCTALTTPPDLSSITSVGNNGMHTMFNGCTALTTPPDLSTITSVDYAGMGGMFYGCSSLTAGPDLSGITSVDTYGMYGMFEGCTALTTSPDLSGITSVGTSGMNVMFRDCTALTTPPDLSSITSVGNYGIAGMFFNCTALTTPPDLSSITSVGNDGMSGMFQGCSSLTAGPDLSTITSVGEGGMYAMFYNCTALTTPPNLSGITSVGISGMAGMFQGCSSLTTGPNLSGITSVGNSGMQYMFFNCTALTTPPYLGGITSVGDYGMAGMFNGCTRLRKVYAPRITWDTSKTQYWLANVAASGTVYADASIINSIPYNNVAGCPSGWTKVRI